ncbi:hypothetical protein [Pseudoxanthomonas sp. Root65]|uniref:AbiJ-NTD4 domain-containing protein n=1 Tax=Pseudoxanthomonas sp. Root65 TaxID=1736576 RepID=UPI000ACAFD7C|nr:hypothetical protein [Pseudoxanthomonas sp. Root65]
MSTFSERMGLKPIRTIVQLNDMDDDLRNSLWNVLDRRLFGLSDFDSERFTEALWWHFFKKPVDRRQIYHSGFGSPNYSEVWEEVRSFFFKCKWNEVYDFIEFVLRAFPANRSIRDLLNKTLERESSGFRVIDGRLAPISDEIEVGEVSKAIGEGSPSVIAHLRGALEHLTDRSNPDYRNSIKEAISAVESMAKIVSGQPKATLGDALKSLERNGKLHPSLKEAFLKLYGYTSDANGIRHALLGESSLNQADARYFLVVCSAFINLIKVEAA